MTISIFLLFHRQMEVKGSCFIFKGERWREKAFFFNISYFSGSREEAKVELMFFKAALCRVTQKTFLSPPTNPCLRQYKPLTFSLFLKKRMSRI